MRKKHPKSRSRGKYQKSKNTNSFGTLMLNKLDKRRGKVSEVNFMKPYKRKQRAGDTNSNFSNDKLKSIKQIYIDSKKFTKIKNKK